MHGHFQSEECKSSVESPVWPSLTGWPFINGGLRTFPAIQCFPDLGYDATSRSHIRAACLGFDRDVKPLFKFFSLSDALFWPPPTRFYHCHTFQRIMVPVSDFLADSQMIIRGFCIRIDIGIEIRMWCEPSHAICKNASYGFAPIGMCLYCIANLSPRICCDE